MQRWSKEKAAAWYADRSRPMGFNYVTSNAVNDIEMWMDRTFSPALIEKELGLAARAGFNSVRVFLSYAVWENEKAVFEANFERFLAIAAGQGLSVMPVLFDDCAFDFGSEPVYGTQPEPVPGVHNSRWVPCPGFKLQDDPEKREACLKFVDAIIGAHREDPRILIWDLYNEPGNTNRLGKCLPLLKDVFLRARALEPVQPLTAGLWCFSTNEAANSFQLEASDIISFHAYTPLERTKELVSEFSAQGRPLFITEWLHRPAGNGMAEHLPYFAKEKIGSWQWGLIKGKTQTNLNWSTMNGGKPEPDPEVWQHDIFYPDGTPYDPDEIKLIGSVR